MTKAVGIGVLHNFMTSPATVVSSVKAALSVVAVVAIVAIVTTPRGV